MRYIPNTKEDQKEMLEVIGADSLEQLFESIPEELRLKKPLALPKPMGEMELLAHMKNLSADGEIAVQKISFLGGGVYNHHIPAVVSSLASNGKFLTAYTPYHPEISQGSPHIGYEAQTYFALLSGMDVVNASLYDGATALAEAILMASRLNPEREVVYVSCAIHPHYREVLQTYLIDIGIPIVELPYNTESGETVFWSDLPDAMCLVTGYPNYFGIIEDLACAREVATKNNALLISVTTEAFALALLTPPKELGVDIFVCEAQSFGIPQSFGGPLLGVIGTIKNDEVKDTYIRQLPGRLFGKGKDVDGKDAYLIVLAGREQHIKREKATSNICTGSALGTTRAAIFFTLYGKFGLPHYALLNIQNATLLKEALVTIPCVEVVFTGYTFNEFVIRTKMEAKEALAALSQKGIYGGIALSQYYPELQNEILVTATEMTTTRDIDYFANALRGILK